MVEEQQLMKKLRNVKNVYNNIISELVKELPKLKEHMLLPHRVEIKV